MRGFFCGRVMEIQFVLGRAGSGKSRYIIEQLKHEDALNKVFIIVPEQFTYQTEKDIMERLQLNGLFGWQVLSVNRLAYRILEDAGVRNASPITDAVKASFVYLAIERCGALKTLGASAGSHGFLKSVTEMINELKKQRITPCQLASAALKSEIIRGKVSDMAAIYASYESISEKYDLEDIVELAIGAAAHCDMLEDATVIIDGFDTLTAQMFALLSETVKRAKRSIICLRHTDEPELKPLFELPHKLKAEFEKLASETGAKVSEVKLPSGALKPRQKSDQLKHLERYLYAKPIPYSGSAGDIKIYKAEDIRDEVREAVSEIRRLIMGGMKYSDIGLVAPESYADTIRDIFGADGIPVFIKPSKNLAQTNVAAYLLSAVGLVNSNFRIDKLIKHMKSGLCALTTEQQDMFLSYQRDFATRGFYFKKPLTLGLDDYPNIEDARKALVQPILRLAEELKGRTEDKLHALIRFMKETETERRLEALSDRLAELGFETDAQLFSQQYSRAEEVIEGLSGALKDAEMTIGQLEKLLTEAFGAVDIAVIPPRADEVTFSDIRKCKFASTRALLVLGFTSDMAPINKNGSALFDAFELKLLDDAGVCTSFSRNDIAERLDIYFRAFHAQRKAFSFLSENIRAVHRARQNMRALSRCASN